MKNYHLLKDADATFDQFFDYAIGWELLDNQKKNGVPNFYEYHYTYNYPKEFDWYISSTLKQLHKKATELREKAKN